MLTLFLVAAGNLPDIDSKDYSVVNRAARQGLNFTIQSTASDILLCGLLGAEREFQKEGTVRKSVCYGT